MRHPKVMPPHTILQSTASARPHHRYVLEDATKDSLVLVDELGKGTEVRAGAAIAAAVLEALDAAGCKVFISPYTTTLTD